MVDNFLKKWMRLTIIFNSCTGGHIKRNGIFYILKVSIPNYNLFTFDEGDPVFSSKKCYYQNCFVTSDISYFDDVTYFDAVVYNIPGISTTYNLTPIFFKARTPSQKYIAHCWDPPVYCHISTIWDGYFNWTWTFRFDSDILWPFMIIKNKDGKVIGPRVDGIDWLDVNEMEPTPEEIIVKLQKKKFAAAWFVSHCDAVRGHRYKYAQALDKELREYGHELHIYGPCGNFSCEKNDRKCFGFIQRFYYFYLSFESAFSEDYVSEKLLTALLNYAVPVVYGGANYTNYIPDGVYLNACDLGPTQLAREMVEAINDRKRYYDYFKWHNHYRYHDPEKSTDASGVCELCAALNDDARRTEITVHDDLSFWWNVSNRIVRDQLSCPIDGNIEDIIYT